MILQKIKKKIFELIYLQPKRINIQGKVYNNYNYNYNKKKFRIKIITAYDKKFKKIGEFCSNL